MLDPLVADHDLREQSQLDYDGYALEVVLRSKVTLDVLQLSLLFCFEVWLIVLLFELLALFELSLPGPS